MNTQNINHLIKGDLIIVELGWSHELRPAIYIKSSEFSVTYIPIFVDDRMFKFNCYINTRHSTKQRVWKITEDNLSETQIKNYLKLLKEVINKKDIDFDYLLYQYRNNIKLFYRICCKLLNIKSKISLYDFFHVKRVATNLPIRHTSDYGKEDISEQRIFIEHLMKEIKLINNDIKKR